MRSHTALPDLNERHGIGTSTYAGAVLLQLAVCDSLLSFGPRIDDGNLARQLIWGALGGAALATLLLSRVKHGLRHFSLGGWLLAILLTYVVASAFWSTTPAATIKRSVLLAFVVLVCAVSVGDKRRPPGEDSFSKVLFLPIALLVGSGILLTLAVPHKALTEIGWRGVSSHKNEAGQLLSACILLLLYGVCHEKLKPFLRTALVVIAIGLAMSTKSTTALLALLFGVVLTEILLIRTLLQRMGSWHIPFLVLLLSCGLIIYFSYLLDLLPSLQSLNSELLTLLGKSDTFTGRTAIWETVLTESRFHNPWLGGGFGGFWVGRDGVSGYVRVGNGLYPGQAHNGYIDLLNDLGYVGIALFGTLLLAALHKVYVLCKIGHPEAKLHLAIILSTIFLNFGESTFLRHTTFMNIVFIACLVRIRVLVSQVAYKQPQEY